MFLILISLIAAKESQYLGSIKYTLQPNQTFEHQFFDVNQIKSLDLYFPDPPYKMIDDSDMNCYWSNQLIGLKNVQTINFDIENSLDSDLVCFDECFIRQGQYIYTTNNITIDLQYSNVKLLVIATEGLLVYYNEKIIVTYDTVGKKIYNGEYSSDFSQKLKQSMYSVQHFTSKTIYLCLPEGVMAYNDEYYIIHYYDGCERIMIEQDYLFIIYKGISIYEISDPLNSVLLYHLNITGDYFDIYEDHIGILTLLGESKAQLNILQYTLSNGATELVNITQEIEGTIQVDSQNIQFHLLNKDIAIILNGEQINLITLQTNFHQKYRHNSGLGYAQHYLDPENRIFIRDSQIIQVSNHSLQFYNATSQSYNLVCNAPTQSKLRKHIFYGIIRSEEKCKDPKKLDERFKEILQHQNSTEIKCYYTFQLSLTIIPIHTPWSIQSKVLLSIFLALVILLIIQQFRNSKKNQTLNSLERFEQLNKLNLQKQKIRITHDDDEDDEKSDNHPELY